MGLLVFLFVLLPFLDVILLFRLGRVIGFVPTLTLVVSMGLMGAMLAKNQGRRMLLDWQSAIARGTVPEEGVIGGMLALLGAVLLILPGVLTDVLGLVLLVPVLRRPFARAISGFLSQRLVRGNVRVVNVRAPRPSAPPPPAETEVGRARYRPGDVIDTEGEEVE